MLLLIADFVVLFVVIVVVVLVVAVVVVVVLSVKRAPGILNMNQAKTIKSLVGMSRIQKHANIFAINL